MRQKFIQVGSSIGAVIPKFLAEEKGIRKGVEYNIESEEGSNRIIIEPKTLGVKKAEIDPAILQWTDEFIAKNRALLERLKDK